MSYYTWKDQEAGEAKACYGPKEGKDQCSATQISGCLPTAAPTVAPTAAPTATPTYACVSELPEVPASPPSPSLPLGSPGVPAGPILPENRLLGFAGPDGGQWCYQQASWNQPDLCSTYYLELGPEDVVGAEGYVPCSAGCDRCEITLKNDVPACRNDRDDGVFTICPTAAPTLAPTVAPTTAAPTVAPTAAPDECNFVLASRSVLTGGDVCKDADINDCESFYWVKNAAKGKYKLCYTEPDESKCKGEDIVCEPTAAPTLAPTLAPTVAPTASPTTCDEGLASRSVLTGGDVCKDADINDCESFYWVKNAAKGKYKLCYTEPDESKCKGEDIVCEPTAAPTLAPTLAPTDAPTAAPHTDPPTVAPTASPTTCDEGLASRSVLTGGDVCKDADINDCESFYWVKNAAKGKYKLCYTEPDESQCKGEDIVCELTAAPTLAPTVAPTLAPSSSPSSAPSSSPSSAPSSAPTVAPTAAPSYACVDSPDPAYYLMGEAGSDGDQWCYQKASGFVGNLDECTNYYVEIGDKAVVEAPGYIACSAGCEYCSVLPKPTNPSMEVCRQASQPSDPDPFIFTICPE